MILPGSACNVINLCRRAKGWQHSPQDMCFPQQGLPLSRLIGIEWVEMPCGVSVLVLMVLPLMHLLIKMHSILSTVGSHCFIVAVIILNLLMYIVCCATVPHGLTILFWRTVWDSVSGRKDTDGFPVITLARK